MPEQHRAKPVKVYHIIGDVCVAWDQKVEFLNHSRPDVEGKSGGTDQYTAGTLLPPIAQRQDDLREHDRLDERPRMRGIVDQVHCTDVAELHRAKNSIVERTAA